MVDDMQNLRRLIEKNARMIQENQKLLKKVRKDQIVRRVTKAIYWVLIAVVSIAGWYYVQPYFQQAQTAVESVQDSLSKAGNILDFSK